MVCSSYSDLNKNVVMLAPTGPILDMLAKVLQVVARHESIMVAVSGGSDSDILLDVIYRLDPHRKARYVFFNTGLETDATRRHLRDLEEKYGIKIEWIPPVMPIPTCCRKYGQPFWSKRFSEYIYRLQRHGFRWEDEPFEVLYAKYPNCKVALKWWCNEWPKRDNGKESSFNIAYAPYLKEFMIANPPTFAISSKCCEKAKKEPAKKFQDSEDFDLSCNGIRKLEKGARADSFKSCFSTSAEGLDLFRPLFWLSDSDKLDYKKHYGITNSDCYEVWGMHRTGCCGCPFGKDFEQELVLLQQYEPKMYKAAMKIFGDSYDYTRRYLAFRDRMQSRTEDDL